MAQDNKENGQLSGLFRSASLTNLFGKKRPYNNDSDGDVTGNLELSSEYEDEDDDEVEESSMARKKRKTELDVKRAEFLEREAEYTKELPEEYRKFRPLGYKFNLPPKDKTVRVYADGVFDLFHLGHMRQLEQAKKALPNAVLIVGIPSDVETHKRKGLTVLSDYQRCETLKHCKWVDEVIPDAPWCVTPDFLAKHKIDYVAHDDLPYASADSDDIYKPIKERGMFLTTQRTEGVSTSDIITKIIRDYDKYLMRNFARGATRQELNVSWIKKNELEFKKHINDFRSYWKKTNDNFNNASKDLYFEVREYLLKKSVLKDQRNNKNKNKHKKSDNPVSQFAADFTGENLDDEVSANRRRRRVTKSPSFIENFKDWMQKTDNDLKDDDNDDGDNSTFGEKSSSDAKKSQEGQEQDDDHDDNKTLTSES